MTLTGEILQPIRLHYDVLDAGELRAVFTKLRCIDDDAPRKRWVWLYTDEAQSLPFKVTPAADNVVLGEFVFKGSDEVVLNLRSFERATNALGFFDQHIPRTVARVTAVTVANRVISLKDASSLTSLDHYFDSAEVVVHDAESMVQRLQDIASSTTDTQERIALAGKYMEEKAKTPLPPMERVALNYYEDGIHSVEALLAPRQVIAMQHWQGNTSYTYHDFVFEMFQHGRRGVLSRCILTGYRILGFLRRTCLGGLKRMSVPTKSAQ
jgi:hypothetical protein